MAQQSFDLIVIGAGPVGQNVADRAKQGGLTVAIVENELVGGECSYWACIPSKALLRSGNALRTAQRVPGAREAATGDLDANAVFARRNRFTHDWTDDHEAKWLAGAGIELFRGLGRITAPKKVTVTSADGSVTELSAVHAVAISTGTTAKIPDIPGLADARPWTSREAVSAQSVPASLAVIGGGAVAVEMATVFASFGTHVTVIARSGLLGGIEPFAGELVAEALTGLGATLHLSASPTSVSRTASGASIELDTGDTVTADEVLVATGRAPHTGELGLDSAGLDSSATTDGWLNTDDTLLVSGTDWLYACGDSNHRALLTHQGKYQARAAGDVIAARATGSAVDDAPWGVHVATADHEAIPQVIFSDPEVAAVGLTAAAAEKAGYDIRVVDYDLGWVSGASLQADDYQGRARMVVDEQRRVVLGMTFVGQDAADLVHAGTIAVVGQVPIERLWHAVPSFPAMSEIWLRLLEQYGRPQVAR
ncbi:MAG TPA: NAD(P)/FAD-dependent oxidoreductase [Homoserinimonas sp.]|nr:NAD(P)/FAD-dependent oxidoreductase [Homoserinimonas sp.]